MVQKSRNRQKSNTLDYFLSFSNFIFNETLFCESLLTQMKRQFTDILMNWHREENNREMPWKGEKNPYRIWLSEVILQQTRVEQGLSYYNRFIEKYPTIYDLAKAPDQEVFKLWEGLGYYNRCRNLLSTAREIVLNKKGIFPNQYEEILQLKGVGPYTAAAIASFAYNLPHAVVDGNVFRVLSRFYGIDTPIDSAAGKQQFADIAAKMLDKKEPSLYNQAIMDFGATICKPAAPVCAYCPLKNHCIAYQLGMVNHLPVKEKTLSRKIRWFTYFLFEYNETLLVRQRTGKDIWQNLFEFYLVESERAQKWDKTTVAVWLKTQLAIDKVATIDISPLMIQQLTHQQIKSHFIEIKLTKIPKSLKAGQWQPKKSIREIAFPKLITQYLQTSTKP